MPPPIVEFSRRIRTRMIAYLKGIPPQELEPVRAPWKLSAPARKAIARARPYTLNDSLRLSMLYGLAREVCRQGIPGDLVECGVCRGGSAAVLAAAISGWPDRRLWLYDSYQGMPPPGPKDPPLARQETGTLVVGTELVKAALRAVDFPLGRALFRDGPFQETFRQPLPGRISVLHIDADWYDSVLSALETFYPAVSPGGWILLDDFGHWEGARRAYYAFCRSRGIEPLLQRCGYTQALWRKEQEHSRDEVGRFAFGIYRPQEG